MTQSQKNNKSGQVKFPNIGDYKIAITVPKLIKDPALANGALVTQKPGKAALFYAGGFAVVFKYKVSNKEYAIRCFHKNQANVDFRTKTISAFLKQHPTTAATYFTDFEYVPNPSAQSDRVAH